MVGSRVALVRWNRELCCDEPASLASCEVMALKLAWGGPEARRTRAAAPRCYCTTHLEVFASDVG